jgi:hypothetical protein
MSTVGGPSVSGQVKANHIISFLLLAVESQQARERIEGYFVW